MRHRKESIIWSPEARADLASIWNYYAQVASKSIADAIVHKIVVASNLIERQVSIGRVRDEIRPHLRSLSVHNHVVFYRLRNTIPEIVRVLDSRRDVDEIFADD